jgi:hypothetical protein
MPLPQGRLSQTVRIVAVFCHDAERDRLAIRAAAHAHGSFWRVDPIESEITGPAITGSCGLA